MAVHHSTFEESMQAALQGHDENQLARPAGRRQTHRETIMSKLARVLAVGALLTVMSLGSTAHAQDIEAQSQQAGITQPAPTPDPPPENPPPPPGGTTPPPPGGTTPPPPGGTTPPPPGGTTPVPRPITVKVSPQAGGPGTTVTVSADVSGCPQPSSVKATFGSAARPLTGQGVSGGQFTARYHVTERDPVGVGQFRVACDNAAPGVATFQVRSAPPVSVSVALSRRAGGPGTTVRITAEVRGGCDPADAFFQDRKGANKPATILRLTDRQLVATYTVSSKDAVGWGRFGVSCNMRTDRHRIAYASFQVLDPRGGGTGGGDPVNDPNKPTQLPKRVDTGLGPTADGAGQDGLEPTWLLLPAGLVLIALAAALRLRQTTARRRS